MKRSVASSPAALSAEARELLELGSFVEPPTSEQDERMDRALARLIALDRATPATRLGQSSSAKTSGPLQRAPRVWRRGLPGSGMSKLLLAVGALAATAGASFWIGRASLPENAERTMATEQPVRATAATTPEPAAAATPRAVTPETVTPVTQEADAPTPAPLPAEDALLTADPRAITQPIPLDATRGMLGVQHTTPSDEEANVPPRRAKRLPVELTPPPLGLSAEIQRLARAEAALRTGHPERTLLELEQPATHLLEQAAALRAIAECTLERAPGVTHARETLLRWPGSAFAPRIREACRP